MLNLKESQYFNSLSKYIQESVMQSNMQFNSETELREFVSNLENA